MAKKRKKTTAKTVKIKPENYIKKHARKLPIHECLLSEDWEERGIAVVIVARKKANGLIIGAGYVLDVFCLGLKQTAVYYNMEMYQYEEMIANQAQRMEFAFKKVEPDFAYNLIYGAVEYAEDMGLNPAKDFRITEYILPPADAIEYIDIEFGKDGKPLYIPGPYDNMEKIVNTLDANLGLGNYEMVIPPELMEQLEDDLYDEEGFDEELEEGISNNQFNFTRVYSQIEEDEIYSFSDKEYQKELDSMEDEYIGLKLDTVLAEIYKEKTEDGSITLHEDLKTEITQAFFDKVKTDNDENEEIMKLIANDEAITAFNARAVYGIESFEKFKESAQGKEVTLRDYVLSAYIRLM